MKIAGICLCIAWVGMIFGQDRSPVSGGAVQPKASAPLSQEQGEEILNELRLIRRALEDRRGLSAAPTTTAMSAEGVRMTVDTGWYALGNDQAPVTMVEFSDFQCPYCVQFNKETFPKLKQAYIDTGKVRFVSREYPLEGHANALNAALAARCAGAQNRYWQIREAILEDGRDLSGEALDREAQQLALDLPKFAGCMKNAALVAAVQRDIADGQKIGVAGTPAFLVGSTHRGAIEGVRIDGAQPYAQFAAAIDAALATASSHTHATGHTTP